MTSYTKEEVSEFLNDLEEAGKGIVRGPFWGLAVEEVITNFLHNEDLEFDDVYEALEYCQERFGEGYDKEIPK